MQLTVSQLRQNRATCPHCPSHPRSPVVTLRRRDTRGSGEGKQPAWASERLKNNLALLRSMKSVHCLIISCCQSSHSLAILERLRKVGSLAVLGSDSSLTLSRFRKYPQITTLDENDDFCHFVQSLLAEQFVSYILHTPRAHTAIPA